MTPMIKTTLQEELRSYALLRADMKLLEARIDDAKAKVLSMMKKEGYDTIQEDFGTFSVVYQTRWQYSDKYKKQDEAFKELLKAAQTTEQESGVAKKVESTTLMFKEPKNDGK